VVSNEGRATIRDVRSNCQLEAVVDCLSEHLCIYASSALDHLSSQLVGQSPAVHMSSRCLADHSNLYLTAYHIKLSHTGTEPEEKCNEGYVYIINYTP